jgi:hypothetical protein
MVATGNGVPGAVESGGLLVEDGAAAEFVGLVVGTGAVIGGDWAVVSWFVDGVLVVSACWLHPYSNNPISVPAAAIWIFRNDFIFIIPLFRRVVFDVLHRLFLLGRGAVGPMISGRIAELRNFEAKNGDLVGYVNAPIVHVLYLNSVAVLEIVERAPWFVLYDNLRVGRDHEFLGNR